MRLTIQIIVILCTLLAFGVGKLHFEDRLNQDMVDARLIQPPLKKGTSLQLGQTGAAVALGGLRSLVAAAWNLRAFVYFEDLEWIKLEQSYEVITTLQPQTIHYWETGAWHMHTNASVYYREKRDLRPFRQRALQKEYIKKGSDFLEEGVRQNPDSWKLHNTLARIWSDHHKYPDLDRAIHHYDDTLACDSLPEYKRALLKRFRFYLITQIPSRHAEALKLGLELYHASEENRRPSLINHIFVLQNALNIPEANRIPDNQLYPNEKVQLHWLQNHWKRRNQDFPMNGVRVKIEELQRKLKIQEFFKPNP